MVRTDDQHRQAFERHRLVAGEVAQVGTDPDEQRADPGRPCRGTRPGEALLESRGGDRGSIADGHVGVVAGTTPRARKAAIVSGPSSNSLR